MGATIDGLRLIDSGVLLAFHRRILEIFRSYFWLQKSKTRDIIDEKSPLAAFAYIAKYLLNMRSLYYAQLLWHAQVTHTCHPQMWPFGHFLNGIKVMCFVCL